MAVKDNVDLICSIGELAGLFEKSTGLPNFLQRVVNLIAYHMRAAVCSVYLYDEEKRELVLSANQGLNAEHIGKTRLALGEGITGKALEELRTIREADARQNPNFKLIAGLDEERFRAFLAVPIVRGLSRVGVIVTQDPVPDYFTENDEKALRAIAAQLASTIENAKLLMALHREDGGATLKPEAAPGDKAAGFFRGARASGGIVCGPATVMGHLDLAALAESGAAQPVRTRADFERAVAETERQLEDLQRSMEERMADVASLIFNAHLLILQDDSFSGEMLRLIDAGRPPVEAVASVVEHYVHLFERSPNAMLREKVHDVRDLGHRLLHNLLHGETEAVDYSGQIVICQALMPSDIVKLVAQHAAGLVVTGGGVTSHAAILARSLELPMIVVQDPALLRIPEGTPVLLDADQGNLFAKPNDEVRRSFQALLDAARQAEHAEKTVRPETRTTDGARVVLLANINLLSDLPVARRLKAEGVGLYRSEMPFIVRNDFPSEEEQYRIYRKIVDEMNGLRVTFRTLDIGGDKMLSYFPRASEANPFLGLRAIRFSLRHRDIFGRQLRALLRAGADANVSIMFPLISSVDDFVEARDVLRECSAQLAAAGVPHNPQPRVGLMLELPSAVELAEDLAREADFICIGTNDLVQYTLAVDRTNAEIASLYVPYHPAVLRSLKRVADATAAAGKALSICGEIASDLRLLPFLLGIGIRTLSLDSRQIPGVQQRIREIDLAKAVEESGALLAMNRIRDIEAYLQEKKA